VLIRQTQITASAVRPGARRDDYDQHEGVKNLR
jgi:hypothetical protein